MVKAKGPFLKNIASNVNLIELKAARVSTNLFQLIRYLKHKQPDVFISMLNNANIFTLIAHKLSRLSTKIVIVQCNSLYEHKSHAIHIKSFILDLFIPCLYPHADSIIAISKGVADDLTKKAKIPSELITTIYNPVDFALISKLCKSMPDHPWLKSASQPVVLAVGRLTHQKDFFTLIKAFSHVHKKINAKLIILGEGELRPQLETLINKLKLSDSVSMPGFVSNPFAYMKHSSVFVLSSLYEGFGNVLTEAMSCGTPIISTDCPSGPREILENGKWGKLIKIEKEFDMANAIIASLQEKSHPNVTKRAAYFNKEKTLDKYYEVALSGINL